MALTNGNPQTETLPKRRELTARSAGQESLVRDPERDKVHFLNPTAAIVWECCDGVTSLSECEQRIRARFTIPANVDLIADIREVLEGFKKSGLLEDAAASA